MKTHTRYYKVTDIIIQFNSELSITDNTFHPKFKLFDVDGPEDDNILINHHFSIPEIMHNYLYPHQCNNINVTKNRL